MTPLNVMSTVNTWIVFVAKPTSVTGPAHEELPCAVNTAPSAPGASPLSCSDSAPMFAQLRESFAPLATSVPAAAVPKVTFAP